MKITHAILTVTALLAAHSAIAEVQVSKIFSNDMVLQRDKSVAVWGTADDAEKVTVTIAGQTHSSTAKDGRWKVSLKPLAAGGPHELNVVGSNTRTFKNILVGDVWLCGGQSNMDFDMKSYMGRPDEIGKTYTSMVENSPSYKNLRVVLIKKASAMPDATDIPVEDDATFKGTWQACSKEVTPRMSATGFVFAQRLQQHLDIPIGLIDANKGGSPVQTWYAPESLRILEAKSDTVRNMYNAMIRPYRDFPIKGVIWYQGESNARSVESSLSYAKEFKAMIRGWRHDFQAPNMPFLFVQLAAYERNPYQQGVTFPILRDSQTAALEIPHTGMAVAIDLGDPNNIHPPFKLELSDRLVLAARKAAYGEDLVFSGPMFKSLEVKGNRAMIQFDHVGSGLAMKDVTLAERKMPADQLLGFQVAGADEVFHDADAEIKGEQVWVSSATVPKPVAVRYAYRGFPYANLYNREGLAASPFRTDRFKIEMDQESATLFNRRLYLPPEYARIIMSLEQKKQVADIHDRHITKQVEKKLLKLKAAYDKTAKKPGKRSPEFKEAFSAYKAILNPQLEKIGAEIQAAGLFK